MAKTEKELKCRVITIRLTDREDLHLRRVMDEEEYRSVSKYVRDKILAPATSKKVKQWDPREEVRKLVRAIRRIGDSYNEAIVRLENVENKDILLKTLVELTREVKKKTDRIINLLSRTESEDATSEQKYLMLQKIEILGIITADAELKTSKNGNQYTGFRVMVTETYGDEKRTTFYDVAFSRNGLVNYLKKNRQVYVSGRLSLSAVCRDDKAYLNAYITANDVELCGSREV